ncbi:hypothetical protein HDU99_009352, partial [Rhizoclosmatium hyalinum]
MPCALLQLLLTIDYRIEVKFLLPHDKGFDVHIPLKAQIPILETNRAPSSFNQSIDKSTRGRVDEFSTRDTVSYAIKMRESDENKGNEDTVKSIRALWARTVVTFEGAGLLQPEALGATPQIALEGSITSLCLSQ